MDVLYKSEEIELQVTETGILEIESDDNDTENFHLDDDNDLSQEVVWVNYELTNAFNVKDLVERVRREVRLF